MSVFNTCIYAHIYVEDFKQYFVGPLRTKGSRGESMLSFQSGLRDERKLIWCIVNRNAIANAGHNGAKIYSHGNSNLMKSPAFCS